MLGPWAAGASFQVVAAGTVTAVTPAIADLAGTRLFTLSAEEAAAIAGVLRDAGGGPPAPAAV